MIEQLYLPIELPEYRNSSLVHRISLREYDEIRERLTTLTLDFGVSLIQSGDVARGCLRLGLQIAEAISSTRPIVGRRR